MLEKAFELIDGRTVPIRVSIETNLPGYARKALVLYVDLQLDQWRIQMVRRFVWMALFLFSASIASDVSAGLRCGGCSDPCRGRGFGYASPSSAYGGYGVGYAPGAYGDAFVQAAPASCGYVAADGSYGYAPPVAYGPIQSPMETVYAGPSVSVPAPVAIAPQVVCEPVTGYRTVMESTFATETHYQTEMETKTETRYRVRKVTKAVPVTFEDFRVKTTMVSRNETKTVEYTVLIPETSTKTVDVNVSVPSWNEISENYVVKVPKLVEVEEAYSVRVPKLHDESFTYTVYAPQTEVTTKIQNVTNAVPVVKTRTIQRSVPTYKTETVTKDYGHWEVIVEEVAGSSYQTGCNPSPVNAQGVVSNGCGAATAVGSAVTGGGCGTSLFQSNACRPGCSPRVACRAGRVTSCNSVGNNGTACGTNANGCSNAMPTATSYGVSAQGCGVAASPATTSRRVWVPNVVTEQVPVVVNETRSEEISFTVYEQQMTQVPYECTYLVYRPEQRTGTRKVVDYIDEPRTRTRKVVEYHDEQRTRVRRELSYKMETKHESYPVVTYRTEKRTKDVSFTVNQPTQSIEPFQSTRYDTVTEELPEEYTVAVQVPVVKEVQVQVCRLVPKLVPYTFNPCSVSSASVGTQLIGGDVNYSGCGAGPNGMPVGGVSRLNTLGCGPANAVPAVSNCGCGQ